jgi:hypothetical protein
LPTLCDSAATGLSPGQQVSTTLPLKYQLVACEQLKKL